MCLSFFFFLVSLKLLFFLYRAKFTMTDSLRTNRSDVSVTYTMRCVADVPVDRLFLLQTLSLTNRCRATAHAVMLLPKHFNELTWHVFRHVVSCLRCCMRDYGTCEYTYIYIYIYVRVSLSNIYMPETFRLS